MKLKMPTLTRSIIRWLILCVLSITLTGCTLDRICAEQDQASRYLPELTGREAYGQTMRVGFNGLYRIDLGTATFARANTAPVIFHLRASPDDSEDLRTVTLRGDQIENSRSTSFVFEPIKTSSDQEFYFYIESPEGTAGNAVTVYVNDTNQYEDGNAVIDHQPLDGDLVFTAYCQQEYTFLTVTADFVQRVKQDIPFAVFYLVVILLLVYASFRKNKSGLVGISREDDRQE